MRVLFLCCVYALIAGPLRAQAVHGVILAQDGKPIPSATVMVMDKRDAKALGYGVTDISGRFSISVLMRDSVVLVARHLSFQTDTLILLPVNGLYPESRIILRPRHKTMDEVVIMRQGPVLLKKDTVVYHADAYAGPDTRKVGDLLSKMQGFQVSPDGRISYNGQPVDRLMIDGEDLAGASYQLITKNLNGAYIDKVEVLLSDHENRLIREEGSTGRVGVNLKIKKDFQGKWTISADVLASPEKRYEIELNSFLIRSTFKQFAFANANNTAVEPLSDAEAYFTMESAGNPANQDRQEQPVLNSGEVIPPDLPDKYVNDNRDMGFASMFAWRTGRYTSMRLLAGVQERQWNAETDRHVEAFPDTSQPWSVQNISSLKRMPRDLLARWSARTDRGLNSIHLFHADLMISSQGSRFRNISGLDISDSLQEHLRSWIFSLEAGWQHTEKRSRSALWVTDAQVSVRGQQQDLLNRSSRYADFFGLPAGMYLQSQQWQRTTYGIWVSKYLNRKWRWWTYQIGMDAHARSSDAAGEGDIRGTAADSSFRESIINTRLGVDLFLDGKYAKEKRWYVGVKASAGPRFSAGNSLMGVSLTHRLKLEYVYRLSMLKNLRVSLADERDLPDLSRFTPETMLSGNGEILGGVGYRGLERSRNFQAGYFANLLHQQLNWSVSLQWRQGVHTYVPSVIATPAYDYRKLERVQGNATGLFLASAEQFIPSLKGKLGMAISATMIRGKMMLNNLPSQTAYSVGQWEVWWLWTPGLHVRSETRLRFTGTGSSLNGANRQWILMAGWSQKFSWMWAGKVMISMLWRASPFGTGKYAHGLDLQGQARINRRWQLRLQAHNLVNQEVLDIRQIGPYQRITSAYGLVGRYLMLGASFQL